MKKFRIHLLKVALLIFMHGCIRDEVLLPPVIISLSETPITSGKMLTITGNNFDAGSLLVMVGDIGVSAAGTPTLTELKIIVPVVDQSKETTLYVQTKYGKSPSVSLRILPPIPAIIKIIPDKAGVGKKVKVAGRYFNEVTSVHFKSPDQASEIQAIFKKLSTDTLEVTVPQGLSRDAADLRISTSSGVSEPSPFTVLLHPVIQSFIPEKGSIGTVVQLIGKEFTFVDKVLFGSIRAEILSVTSEVLEVRVPENAATDTIHIQSAGGAARTGKKFGIIPKPVITSLDKISGNAGTDITITGQNFQDAFEIRFADTPGPIISNTGTVLKTKVPASAGSGKISVTTPAGTGLSEMDFEIQGSPLISSFSPAFGGIGTTIRLTGRNLLAVSTARIGVKDLKINSKTDTQIEGEIMTGSVTGKISVISAGSTFITSDNFTIAGTPQITSVSPISGTPGTVVTITGINFSGTPDVTFSGGIKATVSKATPTEIICQVPATAITGKINVNGAISPPDFTIITKPTISSIVPMKGGVDKEITINGTYLTGATIKFFNNVTATKVGADTDAKIIVKVPAGSGTGKISVTTTGGVTTSVSDFELIPPPVIVSFSPLSGPVGTTITINGTNLHHNPTIQFFNQVTATIKSVSATQILVDVPPGTATGKITVKTDAVNLPVPSSASFTLIGKPMISSLSPATGTIYEKVTINGTNLGNLMSVNFDGIPATTFISSSATQIVVRVPENIVASVNRSINVNVKTSADISGNITFSLQGTPVITKVSPDNNPSNWAFLIEGTNLGSVKKISIDGMVPDIGTNGIDKQAYNYVTTKVPKDVTPAIDRKLRLHYTSDDTKSIEVSYEVLSVPPPGVFPPATMILPPPLPVNYAQTDLSNYWIDENFKFTGPDSVLSCYQLRAAFQDEPQWGEFCGIHHFYPKKINGVWEPVDQAEINHGNGTWNRGFLAIYIKDRIYTGRVLDAQASRLVLTDQDGRQLILKMDLASRCEDSYGFPGPCE